MNNDDDGFFSLSLFSAQASVQFILANNSIKFGAIDPKVHTHTHPNHTDSNLVRRSVDFHFHFKSRDLLGRVIKTSKRFFFLSFALLLLFCQAEKKIHVFFFRLAFLSHSLLYINFGVALKNGTVS